MDASEIESMAGDLGVVLGQMNEEIREVRQFQAGLQDDHLHLLHRAARLEQCLEALEEENEEIDAVCTRMNALEKQEIDHHGALLRRIERLETLRPAQTVSDIKVLCKRIEALEGKPEPPTLEARSCSRCQVAMCTVWAHLNDMHLVRRMTTPDKDTAAVALILAARCKDYKEQGE